MELVKRTVMKTTTAPAIQRIERSKQGSLVHIMCMHVHACAWMLYSMKITIKCKPFVRCKCTYGACSCNCYVNACAYSTTTRSQSIVSHFYWVPSFMSISTMVIELREFNVKKKFLLCPVIRLFSSEWVKIITNESNPVLWCLTLTKWKH